MSRRNPLERRADLLKARMERRIDTLVTALTEPRPPFRVPVSEEDQVRNYLDLREQGQIGSLRERNGGPYSDEQVDKYVVQMERALVDLAPHMVLKPFQDPPDLAKTPLGLPEGLLAALGLDGQGPATVPSGVESDDAD